MNRLAKLSRFVLPGGAAAVFSSSTPQTTHKQPHTREYVSSSDDGHPHATTKKSMLADPMENKPHVLEKATEWPRTETVEENRTMSIHEATLAQARLVEDMSHGTGATRNKNASSVYVMDDDDDDDDNDNESDKMIDASIDDNNNNNNTEGLKKKMENKFEKVKDSANKKMENTKEKMSHIKENVKETIKNEKDLIKNKMSHEKEILKEKVNKTTKNIQHKMENTKEKIEDKAENTKTNMKNEFENTKNKMENKGENMKEKMEDKFESTKDNLKKGASNVVQTTKSKIGEMVEKTKEIVDDIMDDTEREIYNKNEIKKRKEMCQYIDHTALKPNTNKQDINKLCNEAIEYGFKSVCVNPMWVKYCSNLLNGTNVKVCSVIGFPLGANTMNMKIAEAVEAVKNGATEIDMVISVGNIKSGEWGLVEKEIHGVVSAVEGHLIPIDDLAIGFAERDVDHDAGNITKFKNKHRIIVKVILETSLLTDDEIIKACEICVNAGADFVKTSTGFANGAGATISDVKLMKKTVLKELNKLNRDENDCQVKASGGIRNYHKANDMINAGATRIGTSSGVNIVDYKSDYQSKTAKSENTTVERGYLIKDY